MIRLVRADERLIHGQTMQFIVTDYSIRRIIVVDDMTAKNPLLKSIFQTAVPKHIVAEVHTIEESVELIKKAMEDGDSTLLLMKFPRTYVTLRGKIEGLPTELNIGAQMAKNGVKFAEYATLSEEDIEACKQLSSDHVRVYFNAIGASGAVVEWETAAKNLK